MMKAVCVEKPGGPENLLLRSIPRPEPKDGEVLIKVHATALNRADLLQVFVCNRECACDLFHPLEV